MRINKLISVLTFILLFGMSGYSQVLQKDTTYHIIPYSFIVKYDTSRYEALLTIKKSYSIEDRIIFERIFESEIIDIKPYKPSKDEREYILIDTYTGGAHCCISVLIGYFENDKFKISDDIYLGNTWYHLEDFNKDGRDEIVTNNDMFAYAFTNYAETRFPLLVYTIEDGAAKDITKIFRNRVLEIIDEFKGELEDYRNFECPKTADEGTFNTDAGSVKTILAAIAASYHSIGETEKGFDLINKFYKCPDKDEFVKGLKDYEYFKIKF